MEEEKYILKLTSNDNGDFHYLLKYNSNGYLIGVEIQDELPDFGDKAIAWMWGIIPKKVTQIDDIVNPIIRITKVETDLSFKAFWDLYDLKVGSRKRAVALWEKLDTSTRIICMKKVREYKYWLNFQSCPMCHADTFLRDERWTNEFKTDR